jgi:serine/threonine protein kinase
MELERQMREALIRAGKELANAVVPNDALEKVILWIWEGAPYIGKGGVLKQRYFAPRAEGDLLRFKGEQVEQILLCCEDLLTAEVALHERGVVHHDIKPMNFFIVEGRGRIGDFGEAGRVGAPLPPTKGTVSYLPPKVRARSITTYDSSTDVYSFGVTILFSLGLPIGEELAEINEDCAKTRSYEESVANIRRIQQQVRALPTAPLLTQELWNLVADVIDPEIRPTSLEVLHRYQAYLQKIGLDRQGGIK